MGGGVCVFRAAHTRTAFYGSTPPGADFMNFGNSMTPGGATALFRGGNMYRLLSSFYIEISCGYITYV